MDERFKETRGSQPMAAKDHKKISGAGSASEERYFGT